MRRVKRIKLKRLRRQGRVRRKVRGTAERPRLTVFRSNKHIYAQLIDDEAGRTICAASSRQMGIGYGGNVDAAKQVGSELGRKAKEAGVDQACFDRGAFRYRPEKSESTVFRFHALEEAAAGLNLRRQLGSRRMAQQLAQVGRQSAGRTLGNRDVGSGLRVEEAELTSR